MTPERRAHIERVAALLERWADEMRTPVPERARWVRAAQLHDALRDAPFEDPLAHGPAAADRAALEGERDRGVLDAVRYHTTGYAAWEDVGRMLYLADFLEPGRPRSAEDGVALTQRVPHDRDAVLKEVARRRLSWVIETGHPLPSETVEFWNALVTR